jgi:hypothetical protein
MRSCLRGLLLGVLIAAGAGIASAQGPGKSPFWAVVASTVIPGGGQFYCENYPRGAGFCCAQATLTAMTLYEHVLTGESWKRYLATGDAADYGDYEHHFDRRNDLLWWDAGVWVLAAADAFVDAHMHGFGKEGRVRLSPVEKNGVGVHVALLF